MERVQVFFRTPELGPSVMSVCRQTIAEDDGQVWVDTLAEVIVPSEWPETSEEEFLPWTPYFELMAEALLRAA